MIEVLPALLFAVLGLGCLFLVLVGLPGTWFLLALALVVEIADTCWLGPGPGITFGWGVLAVALGLAALGEGLELVAGLLGVKAGGGSKRGMVGAFVGGLVGALLGTFLLPLIGTLAGSLLGTFAGAMIAERTGEEKRDSSEATRSAITATLGHVLGSVGKMGFGLMAWLLLVASAFGRWFAAMT